MPQQDTGLGWSALSEWLISVSGQLCTLSIGGPDHGLTVPYYPDDPRSNPALANSSALMGADNYPCNMFAVTTPGVDVCIFNVPNPPYGYTTYLCTNTSGVTYNAWWAPDASHAESVYFNLTIGTYDSATGLYYTLSTSNATPSNIPVFPTLADALAEYTPVRVPVSKDNPGYAVACDARWKTTNGTEMHSPILISTDPDFVEMSGATGYNLAKFEKLLNGVRFYMGFWDIPGSIGVISTMQQAYLTDRGNIDLERLFMTIASTSFSHIIIINSPDPYEEQTGASGEEGGDGEDLSEDDVDFTPLPSSMAVASGFITLFCPSQYELNQLGDYMWGPLFDVDTIKKLFANPMDCILGLSVYPFPISADGTKIVSVGGKATTVSMGYTLKQYWPVDCGSVYVPKQWGAYMDYAPYTKFNIFLPYIGFRQISADDIMGKTISLRYMVDILSGACNAELKCGSTVLYSWAGSCAAQIPITGNDWRSAITAGVSIAGSIAATVLTHGASAPMIAGTIASATVNSTQLKPEVQRSGAISGSSGFLAGQRPYLVRTTPRSAIPANQNRYSGYPSFVTILLGSLTGYNEIYSVHLENIPATGAELDEIESILKGGAIF